MKTNGAGFTTLHTFTGTNDGAVPFGALILSGNTLYGTAEQGGLGGSGTVFATKIDGTGFSILHRFSGDEGYAPRWGLVASGNTLYGTTLYGGSSGVGGTLFSISLQPQLNITPAVGTIILTWPTNFTGFTLQSTTNLVSAVWNTNLPAPVIVNEQNTLTNPISGTQQFFRLAQ